MKRIDVGGITYRIKTVPIKRIEAVCPPDPGENIHGITCPDTCEIFISRSLPPSERKLTEYEEILHAMDSVYNLRLSHLSVKRLALALMQMGWRLEQ